MYSVAISKMKNDNRLYQKSVFRKFSSFFRRFSLMLKQSKENVIKLPLRTQIGITYRLLSEIAYVVNDPKKHSTRIHT